MKTLTRFLSLILLIISGFYLLQAAPTPRVTGEGHKDGSGRPQTGLVTVDRAPRPSTSAADFDAERVWSIYDDWEPAVAADPSSSYVYQLTTRYDGPQPCPNCPLPAILFRRSADGGLTWAADQFLAETPAKTQNDPQIEVAADGTIYAVFLNQYRPGVKFTKSSDHGDTWTEPIEMTPPGSQPNWSDRPVLAISAGGQHVYVAFNASDSYVAASHDYGATFSEPVQTSDDGRYWFHSAGAVAADGTVYFGAADYSQDYTGNVHINALKSADGGVTWTTTRLDTSRETPTCAWANGCYPGFLGPVVGIAVDGDGRVLLAYNAGPVARRPQRLFARFSPDGGQWSPRQELSNGERLTGNGFPAVAAGPTPGDFRVVWQANLPGDVTAWNTWYRRTMDGGQTWSAPVRLSDRPDGAPYKHAGGYFFPYGDYLEIAVDGNGMNHVIWGAGADYIGPGGAWYTRGQ